MRREEKTREEERRGDVLAPVSAAREDVL